MSYLSPKFASFQKEYDQVVGCNRCGFCETVCPTYLSTGKETLTPRGRNQAFRQILEGKILNPKMAEEIFSTCLTCHACTNVCFSEVPVAKLMAQAKNIVSNPLSRMVVRGLGWMLASRKFFSVFLWCAFLLKRLHISTLLKKIGLLKIISPPLVVAEELIENVPLKFGSPIKIGRNQQQRKSPVSSLKKIFYFSGCGIHYLFPQVAGAFLEILRVSGKELLYLNNSCCGLISHSFGDLLSARKCAQKNIERMKREKTEAIVVDDDSCCGFMKSYGELLEEDEEAVAFSRKVKNLSEFILSCSFKFESQAFYRLTYHDPCQMGNAHKAWNAPREILKNLGGVEFVEMEDANSCCGGAGLYCLKHPQLAEDVLERKLENIKKTRAQIVLTQAASCLLHIGYGLRKKGWRDFKVMHLLEFLQKFVGYL